MLLFLNKNKIYFNSLILSLFIAQTLISSMVYKFFKINNISLIITTLIMLFVIINNKKYKKSIITNCLIMVVVIVLFIYAFLYNKNSLLEEYFAYFCLFGSAGMLLSSIKIDYKTTFNYLINIYIIYLIFYIFFLRSDLLVSNDYWSRQMGQAYSFVSMIILSFPIPQCKAVATRCCKYPFTSAKTS